MIQNFQQTAKYLGVAQNTLRKMIRDDKTFPRPIRLSERRLAFKISEVDKWLDENRIEAA